MTPPARPLVVVVIGSECTGKTTLAGELARLFDVPWSKEFAREYVGRKPTALDASDVEPIARGQAAGEQAAELDAAARGRGLVVRDTDLYSTTVYSRHYYGSCPAWVEEAARERAGDLYLLLCPDVPWVPDGPYRDRPDEDDRRRIHGQFRGALARAGVRVVEIRGSWGDRRAQAVSAVASLTGLAEPPAAAR